MDLSIYLRAQDENENDYKKALNEIRHGKKSSCWIWYVFPIPCLEELMADFYSSYFAFENVHDAYEYFDDPVLRERLLEITSALLLSEGPIDKLMGSEIDKLKLWSCMTLFCHISPETPVFKEVIDKFYEGRLHEATVVKIREEES